MPEWIVIFYPINFLSAYVLYIYLYHRRKRIGFHLGMNISMAAGGGLALGTGIVFINLHPLYFLEATLIAVVIGCITGILFGNLFDYQTILTGFINGLIMGIMAPMVGAVAFEGVLFLIMVEIFIICIFIFVAASAYKA
ncbi:hypothetical protein [Mesobacillus subterraneus]|uniref:Uncharacterized protein n=1 Tax=Mesobacillus subterraneus TaxID=285983 RepID=A0A427TM23_9BACI|nr:hypothetical protein [Mesobacillus subterraneus]RSD25406.1 hypothetical protein EJA10_16485 [Mesobacillus subterraneus]